LLVESAHRSASSSKDLSSEIDMRRAPLVPKVRARACRTLELSGHRFSEVKRVSHRIREGREPSLEQSCGKHTMTLQ
jgi:hypothetical protein